MNKIKEKLSPIRVKLFLTLSIVVLIIILFLIIVNTFVLEPFYLYSKTNTLRNVYDTLNKYYNNPDSNIDIDLELEKIALNNNFDIIIKTDTGISVFTLNKDFVPTLTQFSKDLASDDNIIYTDGNTVIRKVVDNKTKVNFIVLSGELDNGYLLYIRIPLSSIQESADISNTFLCLIGGFTILIGGIVVLFISKRFTEPILELNEIAKKMSNLDFSSKYKTKGANDEINDLGNSINTLSEELEKTIKKLQETNIELEKDVEEKSKIDEMRKQFISDVSHELKTPISLIQGYTEGLLEYVNTDEESRKFYAEVILDEANKMDKLVKQLLELMKLEYGKRQFNNMNFNITELIKEITRKSKKMLDEQNIKVELEDKEIYINADEFYLEQVITNYFTNAIKHVEEVNGNKLIKISTEEKEDKIRVSVFNTGQKIKEEDLNRIWNRFYKVDSSRNRENGGTGIGLALVKAIMNNYGNNYGVINKEDGVGFNFEVNKAIAMLDKPKEE